MKIDYQKATRLDLRNLIDENIVKLHGLTSILLESTNGEDTRLSELNGAAWAINDLAFQLKSAQRELFNRSENLSAK